MLDSWTCSNLTAFFRTRNPTDDDADVYRPYSYDSLMHYSKGGSRITTPAGNRVRIGRRTGGFNGNDASQIRQIYSCAVPFADNPSAVRPPATVESTTSTSPLAYGCL